MFATKLAAAINSNKNNSAFANVQYTSAIKTAAKHKHVAIHKVVNANVIVFATSYAYTAAVQRSAQKHNAQQQASNFKASATHFTHSAQCYSIVTNNNSNKQYLYCAMQNATSTYYINDVAATKQQVAQYLTASAAKQLLADTNVVHNVTNNITHTLQIRTISLANIQRIKVNNTVIVQ